MTATPRAPGSPPDQSPPRRLSDLLPLAVASLMGNQADHIQDQQERVRHLVITGQITLRDDVENLPAYLEDLAHDYAAGVPLNSVDEALFRRLTEGERDRNGNLIWLRRDGNRR